MHIRPCTRSVLPGTTRNKRMILIFGPHRNNLKRDRAPATNWEDFVTTTLSSVDMHWYWDMRPQTEGEIWDLIFLATDVLSSFVYGNSACALWKKDHVHAYINIISQISIYMTSVGLAARARQLVMVRYHFDGRATLSPYTSYYYSAKILNMYLLFVLELSDNCRNSLKFIYSI